MSAFLASLPPTPEAWAVFLLWVLVIWALASLIAAPIHLYAGPALDRLGGQAIDLLSWLVGWGRTNVAALYKSIGEVSSGLRHVTLVRIDKLRTSAKRAADPASERGEGHERLFHRSSEDCSSASRRARDQSTGRTVVSSESAAHDAGHWSGVPSVGHWSMMGCRPLVVVRQNAAPSLDAAEAATNRTTANAARSRAQRRDFAAVAAGGAARDARLSISGRNGTARGSSHEHREAVDT